MREYPEEWERYRNNNWEVELLHWIGVYEYFEMQWELNIQRRWSLEELEYLY